MNALVAVLASLAGVGWFASNGRFDAATATSMPQSRRSTACEYEENCDCAVPGITVRWKAAYCMFVNETDDLENQGVSSCLAQPDPASVTSLDACAQNAHWKEQWCAARHKPPKGEDEDAEAAVRACVEDPEMIPALVKSGAGGDRRPRRR
jgi:hypothetical protein